MMVSKGFQAGKVNIAKISTEPNHGKVEEPEGTQARHPIKPTPTWVKNRLNAKAICSLPV